MSKIHFVKVLSIVPNQRGALREVLPGFKKVWEVISKTFVDLKVDHVSLIEIHWPSGSALPTVDDYRKLLAFKGQIEVELVEKPSGPEFLILQQGMESSFELLLREGLQDLLHISPLCLKEHSAFCFDVYDLEPKDEASLLEALKKLSSLEHSKLGLGGVGFKTLHFLHEEHEYNSYRMALPSDSVSIHEVIDQALDDGERSPLHRPFVLNEKKSRLEGSSQSNPSLFSTFENCVDSGSSEFCRLAPGSFMIGSHLRSIDKVIEQSAMADVSPGSVIALPGFSSPIMCEFLSELPLNVGRLPPAPEGGGDLYMIGPWSSQNLVLQRRLLNFHRREKLFSLDGWGAVIVDGQQDWIQYLFSSVSNEVGWESPRAEFAEFLKKIHGQSRYDLAGFFWTKKSQEEVLAMAQLYGVSILKLGSTAFSGRVKIWETNARELFDISLKDLRLRLNAASALEEFSWEYPKKLSPTYGFDRASIYPEQYLLKVLIWNPSDLCNVQAGTRLHSGVQMRTSRARKRYCQPVNTFIWSDGKEHWVDAVSTHVGWSNVDPRGAGLASVDACLRDALVMGAKPGEGTCHVWIPYPEKNDLKARTMWHMSMQGIIEGISQYGYRLSSVDISGSMQTNNRQEIFIKIRAPLLDIKTRAIPGFRMEGEAIYAIGPKPAVVDAGSRILKYLRVDSNSTFRLQPSVQLKLYRTLYECFESGMISSMRSIDSRGIAGILAEMGLWGDIGIRLRPNVPTIELYSASPGRFVVGVLPQEMSRFEAAIGTELATLVGVVGGSKIMGLPLENIRKVRDEVLEE